MTPRTDAGPPEWLNVEYLASRGVMHPRSLELVAAAMDWGRDYGMFEVESLTDSLALIEAQARTEALAPCDGCGSIDRWLHAYSCKRYYGGPYIHASDARLAAKADR